MTRNAYLMLHLVPAVLLVASTGSWPYGYYVMLRFVVCIAAAWLAVFDFRRDDKVGPWSIVLGLGAILFNPFVPIHLTREIWFFLDFGMAALFGAHLVITRGQIAS